MKHFTITALALLGIAFAWLQPTKVVDNTRSYEYEAWCDSIWEADPDYYMDVLIESDTYQTYIEEHGEWWGA